LEPGDNATGTTRQVVSEMQLAPKLKYFTYHNDVSCQLLGVTSTEHNIKEEEQKLLTWNPDVEGHIYPTKKAN
jgi:hypothetical protein